MEIQKAVTIKKKGKKRKKGAKRNENKRVV